MDTFLPGINKTIDVQHSVLNVDKLLLKSVNKGDQSVYAKTGQGRT